MDHNRASMLRRRKIEHEQACPEQYLHTTINQRFIIHAVMSARRCFLGMKMMMRMAVLYQKRKGGQTNGKFVNGDKSPSA
jgi:hypothetical protein